MTLPLIPEGCHTKGTSARNEKGGRARFDSPDACSWCLSGWIDKHYANSTSVQSVREGIRDAAKRLFGDIDYVGFNDMRGTTLEQVNRIIQQYNKTVEVQS